MVFMLAFMTVAFAGEASVGNPAPAVVLNDVDGKPWSLEAHRGKTVVLEWFNPDCPYVKFAHGANGPMGSLSKELQDQGVVWVAINSGAPGKQGAGADRNRLAIQEYGMGYPVLLDPDGAVGRAYGAKTTPHMYVVNPGGTLVYAGALDNAPMGESQGDLAPYLKNAAKASLAGVSAPVSSTKAYGCSVKYASP